MTIVRLLADDLTGALDTAAEFVPLTGELPVFWLDAAPFEAVGSLGLDSGTRERDSEAAAARVERLAPLLQGADIAFKKIDSLMRGATSAEIAACMRTGFWRYCILAPAFPYQGRITCAGRQYRKDNDAWVAISDDLAASLGRYGVPAQRGAGGTDLLPGITVFDAETDADLRRIASAGGRCAGPILWAGSGGLAQALAADRSHPPVMPLPRPILGLFGSDQAVTAGQLAACEPHWLHVEHHALDAVPQRLAEAGLALVSFRLPADTPRASAALQIAAAIARLIDQVGRPGTVIVAGGETLRSLCDAIGARALSVTGRLVPGVPLSVAQGGQWDGVTIVSKSGAFGHASLLRELILERADL